MRSLNDAGLASLPPFIRPTDLDVEPFEILNAKRSENGYGGNPEIVYTIRDIRHASGERQTLRYDDDGNPLGPIYSMSLSVTPSRQAHADWFLTSRETLGPCQFQFLAPRVAGQSSFANIIDYAEPGQLATGPRAPIAEENARPVPARRTRGPATNSGLAADELEDLPF